jgi:hypothetical protein
MEAISSKPKYKTWLITTSLVMAFAVLIPFLVHLRPPHNGIPMGAYFLPMFYMPFIALVWFQWRVALPVALIAPLLNFLVTGNPQWGFLAVLTLELLFFTGFAFLLLSNSIMKWIAAPLSYLGAKAVSSFTLLFVPLMPNEPLDFFMNSVYYAVPGLMVLTLINLILLRHETPPWKSTKEE